MTDQTDTYQVALNQAAWELNEWRKMQEELRTKLEAAQAKLEACPEYQEFMLLKGLSQEYQVQEAKARLAFLELGMQKFDGTNKRPVRGMQVKEYKTVAITDKKAAMTWASTNCPDAVTLNEKVLAKATELLDVGFVSRSVEFKPNLVEKELAEYGKLD